METYPNHIQLGRAQFPRTLALFLLIAGLTVTFSACQKGDSQNKEASITERMAEEHKNDEPKANESAQQPSVAVETERVTTRDVGSCRPW